MIKFKQNLGSPRVQSVKQNKRCVRAYRIKKEFYTAMHNLRSEIGQCLCGDVY
jgi:hypothetical protein